MYTVKSLKESSEASFPDAVATIAYLKSRPGNSFTLRKKVEDDLSLVLYVSVDPDGLVQKSYGDKGQVAADWLNGLSSCINAA